MTSAALTLALALFAQADSFAPSVIEPPEPPPNLSPASDPIDPGPIDTDEIEAAPEVKAEPESVTESVPESEPETQAVEAPVAVETAPAFEQAPAPAPPRVDKKAMTRRERERILESPTQAVELYEKTRKDHNWDRTRPTWSFNLGLAPRAFRNADLRVPVAAAPSEGKPRITGLLFAGERVLMHDYGQLAVGGEYGFFGNTHRNQFAGLLGAIMTLGPYLQYEGHFMSRQILVPAIKAGYEVARINYSFAGNKVRDIRAMPRLDLGLLLYLNFLEPRSAGLMETNYGIKRTYLAAYYSLASDPSKKDIDLSDRGSYRVGFRFEF